MPDWHCLQNFIRVTKFGWRFLLELAGKLGLSFDWQGPEGIFQGMAETVAAFEGLSYETVGAQGAQISSNEFRETTNTSGHSPSP